MSKKINPGEIISTGDTTTLNNIKEGGEKIPKREMYRLYVRGITESKVLTKDWITGRFVVLRKDALDKLDFDTIQFE